MVQHFQREQNIKGSPKLLEHSPFGQFSFDPPTAPGMDASQIEELLRRGNGVEAERQIRALFERHGHDLYERFAHSAPIGLSGGLEPLRWYKALHAAHEWEVISALAETIAPMERGCEFSGCIPVEASEEPVGGVLRTLEQYALQSAAPERFEVMLFLNWPADVSLEQKGRVIQLHEAVQAFSEQHPTLRLRVISAPLLNEARSIGFIRKVVHDVGVARELTRGVEDRAVLHLRGDADLLEMPQDFIDERLRLHARYSDAVVFRGGVRYPLSEISHDPALLFGVRFDQALSNWISTQMPKLVWGGGPNVSFSSSRYASCSGFSRFDREAEDSSFNFRASSWGLPEVHSRLKTLGKAQRLCVSARRLVAAAENGIAPACVWVTDGKHAFSAGGDSVRAKDDGVPADALWQELRSAQVREMLEAFIRDTVSYRMRNFALFVPEMCNQLLPYFRIEGLAFNNSFLGGSALSTESAQGGRSVPPDLIQIVSIEGLLGQLELFRALHRPLPKGL